jgi:O-antigen polymerase
MVPNRFYPRYSLVKLYLANGDTSKALECARNIMEMEVKIPSKSIDEIKKEMNELLSKVGKPK